MPESTENKQLKAKSVNPDELKKLRAQFGSGLRSKLSGNKSSEKLFINKTNETLELGESDLDSSDSVYFKNCIDCNFIVNSDTTKIFIEGCDKVNFTFNGRVITQTVEVWKCNDFAMKANTAIKTLQIDLTNKADIQFEKADHFNRIVWAATEDLKLAFDDNEEHKLEVGTKKMIEVNPNVKAETDQFIIRLLPNKLTGKLQLLNELIVRLENGFPTTERESRQFEEKQEANLQKLARDLLGKEIKIGKKKDVGPKVSRNDPCTCGSGKKYKKCCGTDAI